MKIFRYIVIILSVVLIGIMSYFGVILYQDFTAVDSNQSQVKDEEQTEQGDSEETQQVTELSEEKFENSEAENLNPFGDSTPQQQLTDKDYQNYIHQMSHQQVEAEEKAFINRKE